MVSPGIGVLSLASHRFSQAPLVPKSEAAVGAVTLLAVGSMGYLRVPQDPAQGRAHRRHLVTMEGWMDEWRDWVSVTLHRTLRERLMLVSPQHKARDSAQTKAMTTEEALKIWLWRQDWDTRCWVETPGDSSDEEMLL